MNPNNRQSQAAGDGSSNFQAARDIHVHGLSMDQARQLALEVYRANAYELAGLAQRVAIERAEQLTSAFLMRLESSHPESVKKLADPDLQSVLFEAQREFARSGEQDLREVLVDLLASRAEQDDRSLRTLALNEAIVSAPKLTERHRRAIAWVFLFRYTRDAASRTPEAFFENLGRAAESLGVSIPLRSADYQHVAYVGAGSVSIATASFGACLYGGNEGLFTRGFSASEVEEQLLARLREKGLVMTSFRDTDRLQLRDLSMAELDEHVGRSGLASYLEMIRPLMSLGRMSEDEIRQEVTAQVPALGQLADSWDSSESGINGLTLTSVGLALGHAYWSRLTQSAAPLSIWL